MSNITVAIPNQRFELIRNRICEIIIAEFNNQAVINPSTDIKAKTFTCARSRPFNESELPAVNVSYAKTDYGNKTPGNVQGSNIYYIDVHMMAKSTDTRPGDEQSNINLDRLLGAIRYILEDPIYDTLGFQKPFLGRTMVNSIQIAEPEKDDTGNVSMGRVFFTVLAPESNALIEPVNLAGFDTQVKLGNTPQGYLWTNDNY